MFLAAAVFILILDASLLNYIGGFWAVVAGFIVTPITFVVLPIYVLVQYGNWGLIIINFGGAILTYGLFFIGALIRGE